MNKEEGKRQLALYRIQQAEESLDEARYLLAGNKSPRSVINRAYYSMFYSSLTQVIFFNSILETYKLRNVSEISPFAAPNRDMVAEYTQQVNDFYKEIDSFLKNESKINH